MKRVVAFLVLAATVALAAVGQTVVLSRKGAEVSATCGGKPLSEIPPGDRTDPTAFLAAFFGSYFSRTDEWKAWVADFGSFDSTEELVAVYEEAYEEFYGRADSISVTIDRAQFKANGDGSAFYTVKIAYSYRGESGEGEDQVAMVQDESGGWLVVELPR